MATTDGSRVQHASCMQRVAAGAPAAYSLGDHAPHTCEACMLLLPMLLHRRITQTHSCVLHQPGRQERYRLHAKRTVRLHCRIATPASAPADPTLAPATWPLRCTQYTSHIPLQQTHLQVWYEVCGPQLNLADQRSDAVADLVNKVDSHHTDCDGDGGSQVGCRVPGCQAWG